MIWFLPLLLFSGSKGLFPQAPRGLESQWLVLEELTQSSCLNQPPKHYSSPFEFPVFCVEALYLLSFGTSCLLSSLLPQCTWQHLSHHQVADELVLNVLIAVGREKEQCPWFQLKAGKIEFQLFLTSLIQQAEQGTWGLLCMHKPRGSCSLQLKFVVNRSLQHAF